MRAQAAKSIVRKEKAHVAGRKAAKKRLSDVPGAKLKKILKTEADTMIEPAKRAAPKSTQGQNRRRKKGTTQNPERSEERRQSRMKH
ncbi:hypothetical protein AZI87_14680 [Bdellovibrio bacteriovorus]|uniref:Uncharacterized protein n=1 Tax=Bdellovibrio bacteriovorus TaxID=959 RepID=A0A161QEC9_BDEBC|nr:hypothetical protein [Bdellovibrio bacteriovorus]KYG62547.1 hypothetical protein AZI87_14680 [Bdellovibrio bacteriovorus]